MFFQINFITFATLKIIFMPKMKTNSSAKKRFKITATGKIMRKKAYKNHILTKKEKDRKRRLVRMTEVNHADLNNVRYLLCK
ncbi:MAG: 50S ribosomal protein L35 [Bacteroidia bacterium]|nr:MAG: 50S ribosomal protein L35 [Bacteroidia bacterium]